MPKISQKSSLNPILLTHSIYLPKHHFLPKREFRKKQEFLNAIDIAADAFPLAQISKLQRDAQHFAGALKVSLKLLQLLSVRTELRRKLSLSESGAEKGEEGELFSSAQNTARAAFLWALREGPPGGDAALAEMRRVAVQSGDAAFLFGLFEFLARNACGLFLLSVFLCFRF